MLQKLRKALISALLLFVGVFILLSTFSLFIQPSDDGIIYLNATCALILIVYVSLSIILVWFPKARVILMKFVKKLFFALSQTIYSLTKIHNSRENKISVNTEINKEKCNEQVKLSQEIEILNKEKRELSLELKKLTESKKEINLKLEEKKRELGILNYDNSEYINNLKESNKESMEIYIENLESEILHKQKVLDSLSNKINNIEEFLTFHDQMNDNCIYQLNYLDSLDGIQFEQKCAQLLILNGFSNVIVTQATNDYGIDIIAEKDNKKYAIQCKNYNSSVGNSSVQEAFTGKEFYKCDQAVVLTNNYFTDNAAILANKTHVLLWDREYLKDLIKNAIK